MKQTLEEFLKSKAAELKSDWADVPQWVIDACDEYINQSRPTAKDIAIKSAEHYLSDSEALTILEQIELIAAESEKGNGDAFIDDIYGVVVWEKLEYQFSCNDFLEAIGWDLI